MTLRRFAMVALAMLLAGPALAGDGRTEINQASVLAAGGFPFLITQSGSYVLTSDLTVADPNTDAIRIDPSADDVTIDLAGFVVEGPGLGGPGTAISSHQQPFIDGALVLRNGTVRGFGVGVYAFADAGLVDGVRFESNLGHPLILGDMNARPSIVVGSRFSQNGHAVWVNGLGNVVQGNVFERNASLNLSVLMGSVVVGNAVSCANSGDVGIEFDAGSVVADNTVTFCATGGLLSNATFTGGSVFHGNTVGSSGSGMTLQANDGYVNNVLRAISGDPVSGGVYLSSNVCNGSSSPAVCDPP